MTKINKSKTRRIALIILAILLISLIIPLALSFLHETGFTQTIWMKIGIVLVCGIIVYLLAKGK